VRLLLRFEACCEALDSLRRTSRILFDEVMVGTITGWSALMIYDLFIFGIHWSSWSPLNEFTYQTGMGPGALQ